ncbi:ABC-2 family transporter protein [Candidatus Woesearchaeota archaeon]|nr:ABC-2 family transporter protein [Candidatus Woesearchaeota archaeon]
MKSKLRKHLELIIPYSRLSFKKLTEYKFNIITNTLGYLALIITWILFWNFIFGSMPEVAEWKYPMLLMLVGFVYLSDALWQMLWYTVAFYHDISKGNLDLYLVRPIAPLYALVMKEFQFFSILPGLGGIGIIVYTLLNYYSLNIFRLTLALILCLVGVVLVHLLYMSVNSLSFWFGKTTAFRTIFRSFFLLRNYPLDIFSIWVRAGLTFILPFYFTGTAQVKLLLSSNTWEIATILFYALIALAIWLSIFLIIWNRGLKRYESSGS